MATILFAKDEYSQPMIDFAAALEQRGHRTVRLLSDPLEAVESVPSRVRWENLSSRWVPEGVLPAGAVTPLGMEVIAEEQPLDIQAMESVAVWMSEQGIDERLGVRKVRAIPDRDVIDKLALTRYLDGCGIAVPRTWDRVADVPIDLDTAVLFKLRESGGGRGVHLCHNHDELRRWADYYGDGTSYLVQAYHPGPTHISAGVAADGELIGAMTYAIDVDPDHPFGFGYGVTVTDDQPLLDYTAAVISTLGVSGPFAMDAVRAADGVPRIVDLNLRVWGSWTACQAAGLDVLGAYEHWLGLGPEPAPPRLRSGSHAPLLRTPPLGVVTPVQRARWLRDEVRTIGRWSHWYGKRWTFLSRKRALGWAVKGKPLRASEG